MGTALPRDGRPAGTALVTGSSRGIGRGIAERLGARRMVVAVHYRADAGSAAAAVAAVRSAGGDAFALRADLARPEEIDVLVADLEAGLRDRTGETALDILVNNAGIGCPGDIATVTRERLDRVFAVNVRAPVLLVQRALPLLRSGARIVNVSSVASRVAHPGILGYAMSKAALDAFGRTIAQQLGERRITVNTVSPGLVDTDFHGDRLRGDPEEVAAMSARAALGRIGRVADVADVVAFLTSDGAGWITGERLETAGGYRL